MSKKKHVALFILFCRVGNNCNEEEIIYFEAQQHFADLCTSSVICIVGFCRCRGSRSLFFSGLSGLDFGLDSGCFMAGAPFAKPEGYSAKLKMCLLLLFAISF